MAGSGLSDFRVADGVALCLRPTAEASGVGTPGVCLLQPTSKVAIRAMMIRKGRLQNVIVDDGRFR
jgi:hypothetical protein